MCQLQAHLLLELRAQQLGACLQAWQGQIGIVFSVKTEDRKEAVSRRGGCGSPQCRREGGDWVFD